jgi:formylglycine-generating enzyme
MRGWAEGLMAALVLVVGSGTSNANVFSMTGTNTSLEFVTVGNPGNAADRRYVSSGVGAVPYIYSIGKFEVTAAQYTEFLNAVARTDTYQLYFTSMSDPQMEGCHITRSGGGGGYTYSVAAEWANRPVNFVSWADAARFANWLTNGQPTGAQDLSTTEDGSYFLNGARFASDLMAVTRKTVAQGGRYYIPTEDEWYKAAYYDPNKPGQAGYWDFATRSNSVPSNDLSSTGTNNANFYSSSYTVGDPYFRTEVGVFAGSPSAYGTFDQTGNLDEWTEAVQPGSFRTDRGGSYRNPGNWLSARYTCTAGEPATGMNGVGFRISIVPEPATLSFLTLGGLVILLRRRRASA